MGNSLLRSKLLTEEEKKAYSAGERYYSAVAQAAATGSHDPFWVNERDHARASWVQACTELVNAEKKP